MCCVENINYDSLFDDTKWLSYCKVSLTSFLQRKRCLQLHVSTNTHMNSIDPCCSMPANTPEAGLSWEISKCWQISLCCRHGACTLFDLHLLKTCFIWAETPQLKHFQMPSKVESGRSLLIKAANYKRVCSSSSSAQSCPKGWSFLCRFTNLAWTKPQTWAHL